MLVTFSALLVALGVSAQAQQPAKIPRIGFLSGGSFASLSARIEALRQGLRELGYVEGKNIVIEWRSADGNLDRLRPLTDELIRFKVDMIITAGASATRTSKEATVMIPIIMTQDGDPVANGFITSLARPGVKETIPKLSRLAVFDTSTSASNAELVKETELAARSFGIQLQLSDIRGSDDIETAFRAASKSRSDALLVLASPVIISNVPKLVELAAKNRLPTMYPFVEFVDAGGLVTYATNYNALYRRAATFVDKLLKGAKPADLPVEQPTKFEFVINLKTAKQIGVTIPPNVLVRADRVIK
jgi:putative ABC transport system substrate-binding protein